MTRRKQPPKRNAQRDADVLTVLRRDGRTPTDIIAELAGYQTAGVVRSLHALEAEGRVRRRTGARWIEWSVAS